MINRLLVCILIFTLILISSIAVFSQNKVEERADLAQVIIEQAQLFSFAESEIENVKVIVYQFQGTAEEAIKYAEETLFENDSKKPEMVFSQDNLVSVLRFFRAFAEQGIVPALDEDWLETAKEKENELSDIKLVSYSGELEYPNYKKEVNIVNPFFSPFSFKLEAGTYIIYSEYTFSEEEDSQIIKEQVELSEETVFEFLIGDWTVQTRMDDDFTDSQIPEVRIKIDEFIGSVWEVEVDAERYLFSGEIEINGEQYAAYEILDPVYMYEYPVRLISLVDDGNKDFRLEILVSRIDDYYFEINSDLDHVNGNSIEINLSYEGTESFEDNYQTAPHTVDYLIRE